MKRVSKRLQVTSLQSPRTSRTFGNARAVLFLFAILGLLTPISAAPIPPNVQAPDFTRVDLNNNRVHLADLRGNVVLLDFWATWCAPCLVEIPHLKEWQSAYAGQGLRILGVSMDDEPAGVRALDRKMHFNYPVVMGDTELAELYGGVLGLPLVYLIDRKGVIRARFDGETDPKLIEAHVKILLDTPEP